MKTQYLTLICITGLALAAIYGSEMDPKDILIPAITGLIGYLNQEKS